MAARATWVGLLAPSSAASRPREGVSAHPSRLSAVKPGCCVHYGRSRASSALHSARVAGIVIAVLAPPPRPSLPFLPPTHLPLSLPPTSLGHLSEKGGGRWDKQESV